jgi:ribonuclease BN (tRNA processing enzyme)
MRLTVVGCAGSYPGPDSSASCYLVEADHQGKPYRLLMDLGNGALGYLHRHVDPLAVDAGLVSHLHPDHCLDFTSYYVLRRYHPSAPFPPLEVWGPSGARAFFARAYGLPVESAMSGEFTFHPYRPGRFEVGPFTVEAVRVLHPGEAYALRLGAGGRALVYSGDTARCDALRDLAHGADLLLAESSFVVGAANPPGIHMTGRDAAELATAAGADRLLLTHIPHWHDPKQVLADARPSFDGWLELAEPGASYDI